MAGARTTALLAGTAGVVAMTLVNERRLAPLMAQPVHVPEPRQTVATASNSTRIAAAWRSQLGARRFPFAGATVALIITIAALVPATTAAYATWGRSAENAPGRAQAAASADEAASPLVVGMEGAHRSWDPGMAEMAYLFERRSSDQAFHDQLVFAGALFEQERGRQLAAGLDAIRAAQLREEEAASQAEAARQAEASRRAAKSRAPGYSGQNSVLGSGTRRSARITIYGCAGPGGGFCGNTSSGSPGHSGTAACSYDLALGTRLRIAGDPTGRVYACEDRGQLPATWIDVFFYDTSDGFAWASSLGTTSAEIEILN